MAQEGQQQTVVITTQSVAAVPQNVRPWGSGLCSCCNDVGSCILGMFCLPCLACKVASRLNENCCVPLCLPGGIMAMRTKTRVMLGIQGSICMDCLTSECCGPLVLCQMDRELQSVGI